LSFIIIIIIIKRCILEQKLLLTALTGNGMAIKWSRDRRRHVTPKGQTRDPNMLRAQYLEKGWRYR